MQLSEIKIIADSSADLISLDGVSFSSAPLKIVTSEKEYVDDEKLNVSEMIDDLQKYSGKSSTSCPSTGDWLDAFGDTKYVFCVTITAALSGSYNAACVAKETYEEEHPDRKVFVFNSLTTGPEMILHVNKIKELVLNGVEFDDICSTLEDYSKKTGLLFVLESLRNLANNGRVSPLVAKMAGMLGIRMVGKASDRGDLQPLSKCRGEKKALLAVVDYLGELGLKEGKVVINHCENLKAAKKLENLIENEFPNVSVSIGECRGLCSFYAEKGGLLIGFEKSL